MSEKNTLQCYCQKAGFPFPQYNTWSEGFDHQKKWFASVEITINSVKTKIGLSCPVKTKVEAEKKVAGLMIEHLNIHKDNQPKILSAKIPVENDLSIILNKDFDYTKIDTIYMIDLENSPAYAKNLTTNITTLFIGFMDATHNSLKYYSNWFKSETDRLVDVFNYIQTNQIIYLSDGGIADLADHLMTLMSYPIMALIAKLARKIQIIIVTLDHAGWCTGLCLKKAAEWCKLDIEIVNKGCLLEF